jgi:hypothetical protein
MATELEIAAAIVVQDREIGMMPGVTIAANGDILVSYDTTIDRIAGGEARLIRSTDVGRTWQTSSTVAKSKLPGGCVHLSVGMTTLGDGRILLPYNDGPRHPRTHGSTDRVIGSRPWNG